MPDKKDVAKLIKEIERWPGWRVERRSRGWMAYPPDRTRSPVAIHSTYSDHRSFQNTKSTLRRAGGPV